MSDKMDQALLKAAVALLKRCESKLLQMRDMEDVLHHLKLDLPGEIPHTSGLPGWLAGWLVGVRVVNAHGCGCGWLGGWVHLLV